MASGRAADGSSRKTSVHSPDRIDAGYAAGDVVPTSYDSLVAKALVSENDREDSLVAAQRELSRICVDGIRTNLGLHVAVAGDADFRDGQASVDWLERRLDSLLESGRAEDDIWAAAAIAFASHNPFGGVVARWFGAGETGIWLEDDVERRHVQLPHPREPRPGRGRAHGSNSVSSVSREITVTSRQMVGQTNCMSL